MKIVVSSSDRAETLISLVIVVTAESKSVSKVLIDTFLIIVISSIINSDTVFSSPLSEVRVPAMTFSITVMTRVIFSNADFCLVTADSFNKTI